MVERDLHNCIKKYRNVRLKAEIKQLSVKFTDLAQRCMRMMAEFPVN